MKKKAISFLMVVMILFSVAGTALAAESGAVPFASQYLDGYTVALSAKGGGKMSISMSVDGVGIQDKIGVLRIDIERKNSNGTWSEIGTQDSVDHPEFFAYNSRDYVGDASFTGTPGASYRVTLVVYARKGTGSDTGYITSNTVVCK